MREKGMTLLGERKRRRPVGKTWRRIRWILIGLGFAGCVGWSLDTMEEETQIRQAQVDISRISHQARLFRHDFGRCPISIQELVDPPDGNAYLRNEKDPWGRSYRVTCPARVDPGGVDVVSGGPDGDVTGADNISSL